MPWLQTIKIVFQLRAWSLIQNENQIVLWPCMCKEMPVIQVNRVGDIKRMIGKNKGPRSRRKIRGR
jgi:hypothetical protein